MTAGFIGMIFGFFTTLFRASLVAPSVLRKLIRIKKRWSGVGAGITGVGVAVVKVGRCRIK